MGRTSRTGAEVYGPALELARQQLLSLQPWQAATRANAVYETLDTNRGQFVLPFLGIPHCIGWPEGTVLRAGGGEPADISTQLILLHYLLTADGTPLSDQWVSFRHLPGGLGYDAAFQARASLRLAQAFGHDRAGFVRAARALHGEPLSFGDASFSFRALPCVWLAVVLHIADDEFPAHVNVLFDAAASHYLPTEDLAVLASMLASRLIRAARNP